MVDCIEPSRAMVECNKVRQIEPCSAMVECSTDKYSQVDP